MTAPELISKVRSTLGYPDSYVGLTNADIDVLLKEAFASLACAVLPARLRGSVSIPLVVGQSSYAIDGNPQRVFAVNLNGTTFLQPTTLTRLEREAPAWSSASGTPERYWLEGNEDGTGSLKIRLYPTPDAIGTVVVSVVTQPKSILSYGNSEVAQWDELGQDAAVFFACWRHGCNGNVIVDPAKMQLWFDSYSRLQAALQSYEDPTSAQAQEAAVERGWRQ